MMRRRMFMIVLAGAWALAAHGCTVVYHDPPPHGHVVHYRAGVELVFDSGLGIYAVSGHPHYYYHSGRFYRYYGGRWQASKHMKGPWRPYGKKHLPPGLRKKY